MAQPPVLRPACPSQGSRRQRGSSPSRSALGPGRLRFSRVQVTRLDGPRPGAPRGPGAGGPQRARGLFLDLHRRVLVMGGRRREGRDARRLRGRETLESYRGFIDDWEAFEEAIRRPEPTTLRANLCRIERPELEVRLERQGFRVEPLPDQPAFLRVLGGPFPISDTLEHWAGLFYIQQAATGWAAPLLDPRPGERVLDLCAAHPELRAAIFDGQALARYVRVMVNGRDIELTEGLNTEINENDQLAIFPPIAGGKTG